MKIKYFSLFKLSFKLVVKNIIYGFIVPMNVMIEIIQCYKFVIYYNVRKQ